MKMSTLFTALLPKLRQTSELEIGKFKLAIYRREEVSVELWEDYWKFIIEHHIGSCHWNDFEYYLIAHKADINVLVMMTHLIENVDGTINTAREYSNLTAFCFASITGEEAFIVTTCGRKISSRIRQAEKRPSGGFKSSDENNKAEILTELSPGIIVRCLMVNYLFLNGVRYIYNDAAEPGLVFYYAKLGFRLGQEKCNQPDPITQLHEQFIGEGRGNEIIEQLPAGYESTGFRMKLCDLQHNLICQRAVESLVKFDEVVNKYTDIYYYGADN